MNTHYTMTDLDKLRLTLDMHTKFATNPAYRILFTEASEAIVNLMRQYEKDGAREDSFLGVQNDMVTAG